MILGRKASTRIRQDSCRALLGARYPYLGGIAWQLTFGDSEIWICRLFEFHVSVIATDE